MGMGSGGLKVRFPIDAAYIADEFTFNPLLDGTFALLAPSPATPVNYFPDSGRNFSEGNYTLFNTSTTVEGLGNFTTDSAGMRNGSTTTFSWKQQEAVAWPPQWVFVNKSLADSWGWSNPFMEDAPIYAGLEVPAWYGDTPYAYNQWRRENGVWQTPFELPSPSYPSMSHGGRKPLLVAFGNYSGTWTSSQFTIAGPEFRIMAFRRRCNMHGSPLSHNNNYTSCSESFDTPAPILTSLERVYWNNTEPFTSPAGGLDFEISLRGRYEKRYSWGVAGTSIAAEWFVDLSTLAGIRSTIIQMTFVDYSQLATTRLEYSVPRNAQYSDPLYGHGIMVFALDENAPPVELGFFLTYLSNYSVAYVEHWDDPIFRGEGRSPGPYSVNGFEVTDMVFDLTGFVVNNVDEDRADISWSMTIHCIVDAFMGQTNVPAIITWSSQSYGISEFKIQHTFITLNNMLTVKAMVPHWVHYTERDHECETITSPVTVSGDAEISLRLPNAGSAFPFIEGNYQYEACAFNKSARVQLFYAYAYGAFLDPANKLSYHDFDFSYYSVSVTSYYDPGAPYSGNNFVYPVDGSDVFGSFDSTVSNYLGFDGSMSSQFRNNQTVVLHPNLNYQNPSGQFNVYAQFDYAGARCDVRNANSQIHFRSNDLNLSLMCDLTLAPCATTSPVISFNSTASDVILEGVTIPHVNISGLARVLRPSEAAPPPIYYMVGNMTGYITTTYAEDCMQYFSSRDYPEDYNNTVSMKAGMDFIISEEGVEFSPDIDIGYDTDDLLYIAQMFQMAQGKKRIVHKASDTKFANQGFLTVYPITWKKSEGDIKWAEENCAWVYSNVNQQIVIKGIMNKGQVSMCPDMSHFTLCTSNSNYNDPMDYDYVPYKIVFNRTATALPDSRYSWYVNITGDGPFYNNLISYNEMDEMDYEVMDATTLRKNVSVPFRASFVSLANVPEATGVNIVRAPLERSGTVELSANLRYTDSCELMARGNGTAQWTRDLYDGGTALAPLPVFRGDFAYRPAACVDQNSWENTYIDFIGLPVATPSVSRYFWNVRGLPMTILNMSIGMDTMGSESRQQWTGEVKSLAPYWGLPFISTVSISDDASYSAVVSLTITAKAFVNKYTEFHAALDFEEECNVHGYAQFTFRDIGDEGHGNSLDFTGILQNVCNDPSAYNSSRT
eukprot:TRINITY_DN11826_c0_g1_i2.p1 TRINITY_DN11826_c0_g1~~TRINITY_DN11826_c0_g1_i2.p1  ORF type:complete len:1360 (-),score=245.80 TRINITY_DN11826_c0_g1_i2:162-3674(-)